MSSLLSRICQLSKGAFRLLKPSRSFFTYMLFLLLSGSIWLAVSLNEYYEREVAIPVSISGVPETVAFDGGVDDTIRVTIRDKGFVFLYYFRNAKTGQIPIDFATYSRNNGHLIVSNSELRREIASHLEGTSKISSIKPEKLDLTFSQCISKVVPVRLAGTVQPAENYYLAQTVINPAKVTIFLSRTMADSVKFVSTEPLNITNLIDTTEVEVDLMPIKGVNMSKRKAKVRLFADILTEEEVEVPITATNVPDGVSLRFFPSRVKVKFVSGVSLCKTIEPSQFVVEADYRNITPGSDKCSITVSQKPHGVVKANTTVAEVDYLIEN